MGCGDIGKKAALELAEKGINTEFILPDIEPERGMNIVKLPEPPPPLTFGLKNYHYLQASPQTRAERRKKERAKKKKRK